MRNFRFLPDRMTACLLAVVAAASFFPCRDGVADAVGSLTVLAIALVFFTLGARLSRSAVLGGLRHWRLHALVLASTFLLFPLLGVVLGPVLRPLVGAELYLGVLFMCMLPSTMQSATTLISIAKGNVPAAVCSASASNLIGIFVAPLLAGVLLAGSGDGVSHLESIRKIMFQLLAPFIAGHAARRWIGAWIDRNGTVTGWIDQASICLVVYSAFSAAVVQGIWGQTGVESLAGLVLIEVLLLLAILALLTAVARRLGFNREDEITIVFCGAKKSLGSGVPMAKVLFPSHVVGTMVLPVMIFHQIQLIICALIAQRYARRYARRREDI